MAERRVLTARELEILDTLCGGLTARQAGDRLGISARAVSNRRTLIYQKLGVSSLEEACLSVAAAATDARPERTSSARRSTPRDAGPRARRPQVRTFPVHDVEFRTHVNSVVQDAEPGLTPRQLEDRLRDVFPSAAVRVREHAEVQTGNEGWIIFRAAHVADPSEDPWWRRETAAWVLLDSDGVFRDINAAAEELLATSRDEAVGRNLFDPVVPFTHEAEEDVRRFWATLRQRGRLRSSLRVPRRDGVVFDLDFYAEANVDGAGHHRAYLRALRPVSASR